MCKKGRRDGAGLPCSPCRTGAAAHGAMAVQVADVAASPGRIRAGSAPEGAIMTDREIRTVDRNAGKLTIRHAEIRNLDMPAMTMVFRVAHPALRDHLGPGDRVHFMPRTSRASPVSLRSCPPLDRVRSPILLENLPHLLKLGCTSFGGPIAHLGYFRREFVERRRWLDEPTLRRSSRCASSSPGPASSQVGMLVGLVRGGPGGALAAWIGFTLRRRSRMVAFALALHAAEGRSERRHRLSRA